jgi:ectoine hydroxylase-related dioxygenase (phytanoyl-CoA dioxygenase family)
MLDSHHDIAERYRRDGFAFPIRVMAEEQATALRAELEAAEAKAHALPGDPAEATRFFREYSNLALGFVDRLTKDPAVTDPVAAILGEDLLVLTCSFFIKEPRSPNYVSWHQDLHYWGLEGDDEVTAWIALSPATRASGAMRFVPGSHHGIVEHKDTFHEDNLLTRGQELAVEVDEADAVDVELAPGEMSLHHGRLFHASDPNTTDDRRIGLAIRYIPASMSQIAGASMSATLVRGQDPHGNFDLVEGAQGTIGPEEIAKHTEVSERRRKTIMRET